jgi:predicted MFS family arabinose efflux permease
VVVITAIILLMIPVVALLLRDYPRDCGLKPYGAPDDFQDAPLPKRVNPFASAISSLGDGFVSRDFWLLSLSFWVCGASTNGLIGTHLIPFCIESGVPAETAAGLLAGMGIFNFIGTTASGWLSDRFDSRLLLFTYYSLRGFSLLFLPYIFDFSFFGLTLFTVFYGLDWIATVPPTVRLAGNSFGVTRAAMMFGWITAMHQVGSAMAAAGAGWLHDTVGTYTSSFLISGALCFVAAAAVLPVGRSPRPRRPIEMAPAGA